MKKIIGSIIAACLTAASICSYAASEFDASVAYLPESGEITVSGNAQGALVILVSDASLLPEDMSAENLPCIVKQIKANGVYSCTLAMPEYADGGKYNVYVFSNGSRFDDSFIYMNLVAAEAVIPELSSANGESFKKLVSDNAENLGIDIDDEFYIQNHDRIFDLLDAMTFENASDFYSKYTKAYALCAISGEESLDKIKSTLAKYSATLGIDYNESFVNEKRLSDEAKKEFLYLLSAADYSAMADTDGNIDFALAFASLKPLAAVKTADNWIDVQRAVTTDFADDFDYVSVNNKYKSIRDKDSVFEEMMKADLSTMKNIRNAFEDAVKKVYSKENIGSGGSSSGGGSSFGGKVTVPENISADEQKEITYSDLSSDHWAYIVVSALTNDGIISGYEDLSFRPSNQITRAEFTKMIIGFAADVDPGDIVFFDDVESTDWYCNAISEAAAKGIVNGDGKSFHPNNFIKREDAALIIYRLMCLLGNEPLGHKPFADRNDISEYAKKAVYALGGAGIAEGSGNNMFMPQSFITRAEAAQLIYNAMINK